MGVVWRTYTIMDVKTEESRKYIEEYHGAYRDIAKILAQHLPEKEVRLLTEEIHKEFNGTALCFTKKLYTKEYIAEIIVKEYRKGVPVKELAKKYDYTERRIRMMVK